MQAPNDSEVYFSLAWWKSLARPAAAINSAEAGAGGEEDFRRHPAHGTNGLEEKEEAMLSDLFSTEPDWTQTIIRLILGAIFFAHGAQKLLGWFGGAGLKSTIGMMHEHPGLPVPIAFLAVRAEFLGGLRAKSPSLGH